MVSLERVTAEQITYYTLALYCMYGTIHIVMPVGIESRTIHPE